MKRPELLAPAGNLEKLKIAFEFGADAVYFGLPDFSLRMRVNQFDDETIRQGAKLCRELGKKFFLTVNIYAHNIHLEKLEKYFEFIKEVKPDGLIVSDPGVIQLAKKYIPEIPLHLSTQANATNSQAVKFWASQGAERVILARELTLAEIAEIKKANPDTQLECFVHGAMCMAYSGRCILSKWMTGRSANLGDCAQPCRWMYHLKDNKQDEDALEITDDKKRFDVTLKEDAHGTYFFNSNDVCLIEHLDDLIKVGVDSFKIEGRAKSVYYLAVVVRAYRKIIDMICSGASQTDIAEEIENQKNELLTLSNRGYSQGFLLGNEPGHLFEKDAHKSSWMFCGISQEDITDKQRSVVVHNYLSSGETLEIITPEGNKSVKVEKITDYEGQTVKSAHGGGKNPFALEFSQPIKGSFLMRKLASDKVS